MTNLQATVLYWARRHHRVWINGKLVWRDAAYTHPGRAFHKRVMALKRGDTVKVERGYERLYGNGVRDWVPLLRATVGGRMVWGE